MGMTQLTAQTVDEMLDEWRDYAIMRSSLKYATIVNVAGPLLQIGQQVKIKSHVDTFFVGLVGRIAAVEVDAMTGTVFYRVAVNGKGGRNYLKRLVYKYSLFTANQLTVM
jgi:hypothetical protein